METADHLGSQLTGLTGLTGCLCLSVANPPKSQSTLSETGIPLQTSAPCFPPHSLPSKQTLRLLNPQLFSRQTEAVETEAATLSLLSVFISYSFKSEMCCVPCCLLGPVEYI